MTVCITFSRSAFAFVTSVKTAADKNRESTLFFNDCVKSSKAAVISIAQTSSPSILRIAELKIEACKKYQFVFDLK